MQSSGQPKVYREDCLVEKNSNFIYNKIRCPSKSEKSIPAYREDLKENLRKLGLDLKDLKGKKVLDAGCGSGELSTYLASWGAEVTGIDFSEQSIAYGKNLAKQQNVQVNFIHGSLKEYPLPKNHFDFVMSHMVLQHVVDPEKAFNHIAKSLKPGGIMFIRLMQLWGSLWPNRRYNAWQYWLVKLLGGNNSEKRARLADKLFFRDNMIEDRHGIKRENYMWDCFASKISYHTYGELLGWFSKNNIEYLSSNPAMEFGKFVSDFVKDPQKKPTSLKGKLVYPFYPLLRKISNLDFLNKTNFFNTSLSQLSTVALDNTIMVSLFGKKRLQD